MSCEIKNPTNNPLCSDSIKDLKDNAIIMDQYINSQELEVGDRLGEKRKTWAGIEKDAQDGIDSLEPRMEQLIDDKIIGAGGIEIAQEWGNSPDKVLSQQKISEHLGQDGDGNTIIKSSPTDGEMDGSYIFPKREGIYHVAVKEDLNETESVLFNLIQESSKTVYSSLVNLPSRISKVSYGLFEGCSYSLVEGIHPSDLDMIDTYNGEHFTRKTAREFYNENNVVSVMNGSAFLNADGSDGWDQDEVIVNGIYIKNGEVISDWVGNVARNQAMCIMNDGSIRRFYRDEDSAYDMVNSGAVFGVSWGAFMLYDGEIPEDFMSSSWNSDAISARSIIMQDFNGYYAFLTVDGVTGKLGLAGKRIPYLCKHLGYKTAYALDGGGSTQLFAGGVYATPSSDAWNTLGKTTRTLPIVFVSKTPLSNTFDTGNIVIPPNRDKITGIFTAGRGTSEIELRQMGDVVHLKLNATYASMGTINENQLFMRRYVPQNEIYMRGLANGGAGVYGIYSGGENGRGNIVTIRVDGLNAPGYLSGTFNWDVYYD